MSNPYSDLTPGENKMGKSLLRSKTFWVNFLTAAVSLGAYLMNTEFLANNPEVVAIAGTVIGGLNILLRLLTKEPITSVK